MGISTCFQRLLICSEFFFLFLTDDMVHFCSTLGNLILRIHPGYSNGHWKILWAPNAQIMNGCQAEHSGGYDWIIPVFSPISSSTYP